MAEDWKSYQTRQHVVQQIDELMRLAPQPVTKTAVELEETLFQRSKHKEEYMQLVTRLLSHLKSQAQNLNQDTPQVSAMLSGHGNQPGQQMSYVGAGGRPNPMISGQNNSTMTLPNQQMGNMTRGPRMNQPIPSTLASSQGNDVVAWQANRQRMNDMQMSNVAQNKGGMNTMSQGKMNQIQMTIANQGGQLNTVVGQIVNIPGAIARPGLQQPRAASPVSVFPGGPRQPTPTVTSMSSGQSSHVSINNQQGQPTPQTFISPSPSNMVPSPAGGNNPGVGNRSNHLGAPSPGSVMINTPNQLGDQQQSPASGASAVEWEYLDKVRQLQKYVEPLKRMIENGGRGWNTENVTKMKKLLDTLQNPDRKITMDVLCKCEQVLVKLEIPKEIKSETENSFTTIADAVALAHKSPRGAHIINRTIAPALNALLGPTFPNPPKRIKRKEPVLPPSDGPVISNLVQGEVARLSPRFKVNLECHQPPGSDDLTFVCQLDDDNLPCVPGITLIIPSDYPKHSPKSCLSAVEYNTTEFLRKVRKIMLCRQHQLPSSCTITMILNLWEMSIRQACSTKPFNADAVSPLFALMNA